MRTSTEAIVPTAITTNRKEPERTMNKEYKTFSSRASAREFIGGNNLHIIYQSKNKRLQDFSDFFEKDLQKILEAL